jgi:hypothetical protein
MGALSAQWNLIVQACSECNAAKAELEAELSALSIRPDFWGRFEPEAAAILEARRKGKVKSHRTGKFVCESREELNVSFPLAPGLTFEGNYLAGPQMDQERAYRLAMLQVSAFFFWVTKGTRSVQCFRPIDVLARGDWGNLKILGFQDLIANWDQRLIIIGASHYFKAVIHRNSDEPPVWAWALEWNKNYRLFGFFGDERAAEAIFQTLPVPKTSVIETPQAVFRATLDVPLQPERDRLFVRYLPEASPHPRKRPAR